MSEVKTYPVRIAFYKAYYGKWWDVIIAFWTWIFTPNSESYSHVEIGFFINDEWRYFSSTARSRLIEGGKTNGTRWIIGKQLLENKEKWDVYEIIFSEESINKMIVRADSILKKRYDWLGILGFITISGLLNLRERWYCSEACHFVLTGLWKRRISPRRFSKKIEKLGFQKIVLI